MKPSGKIQPPDQRAFEREINAVSREIKEKQSKLVSSWCWRGGGRWGAREEGEIEILLAVLLGQVNYSSGTNQPTGVPKSESGCQCQQKLPNSIHPHTFQAYLLMWQTQGGHTNWIPVPLQTNTSTHSTPKLYHCSHCCLDLIISFR